MFTGNIRVIDFGESSFLGDPPSKVGTPLAFRASEIHFNRKASDVWALACTIYEIRVGLPVFEVEYGDESSMEAQIIAAIGPTSLCTFTCNTEDTEMPDALDYLPLRGLVDIIDGTYSGTLITKPDLRNGSKSESQKLNLSGGLTRLNRPRCVDIF